MKKPQKFGNLVIDMDQVIAIYKTAEASYDIILLNGGKIPVGKDTETHTACEKYIDSTPEYKSRNYDGVQYL